MNHCKLAKYGCTYRETGCSDCKVNQAYQQGRADAIEEIEKRIESLHRFDSTNMTKRKIIGRMLFIAEQLKEQK